jgi:hypothetical protein
LDQRLAAQVGLAVAVALRALQAWPLRSH